MPLVDADYNTSSSIRNRLLRRNPGDITEALDALSDFSEWFRVKMFAEALKSQVQLLGSCEVTATAASTTYVRTAFTAHQATTITGIKYGAQTEADYATVTLALAKIRAGASTNLLSTTNQDIDADGTFLTGDGYAASLTLSTTATDLVLAANDQIIATIATGATQVTAGANLIVSVYGYPV